MIPLHLSIYALFCLSMIALLWKSVVDKFNKYIVVISLLEDWVR